MRRQVDTINGKRAIGNYDPTTKIYSKWVRPSHQLWKAGGAFTVDKSYIDDVWPDCEWVFVWSTKKEKWYYASTSLIRESSWRDTSGKLHHASWGDQYALPFMYWKEDSR